MIRPLILALLLWSGAAQAATLTRGNPGEPESLDPARAGIEADENIVGDMLMGLTTPDTRGEPIPGAATRWEVSPDGKSWTFHLRKEVWSDGTPVTADDFVFAWRRLLDPRTASRNAYILWVIKNGEAVTAGKLPPTALGVRAKDRQTLVVELAHPAPYLPEVLALSCAAPLPQHAVEELGDKFTRPGAYIVNGPYLLKEWVPNDHVLLVKNPRFYDAAHVRIDAVRYVPSPDANAGLKRYRAGELDTLDPIPMDQIGWIRANLKPDLHIAPMLGIAYLPLNLNDPALKDVQVRRALNLAYDREPLVEKILKLGEAPAYGYVPPGVSNFTGGAAMDFKSLSYPARLAEARKLMQAAGYGPSNRLQLTLSTTTNPDSRRVAAVAQAMMSQIYLNLRIETSDPQVYFHSLRLHQFQIGRAVWLADYDDASDFLDLLRSDSGNNYAGYRNPKYDALLDAAQNQPDTKKRAALLRQAEALLVKDYPWIPERYYSQAVLVKPAVKGWVPNIRLVNRSRWLWLQK
jgi:oligopeptide transport system substrate-binding protein